MSPARKNKRSDPTSLYGWPLCKLPRDGQFDVTLDWSRVAPWSADNAADASVWDLYAMMDRVEAAEAEAERERAANLPVRPLSVPKPVATIVGRIELRDMIYPPSESLVLRGLGAGALGKLVMRGKRKRRVSKNLQREVAQRNANERSVFNPTMLMALQGAGLA